MSVWFLISIVILVFSIVLYVSTDTATKRLPPGPTSFPIVGNLLWLGRSPRQIEPLLRDLRARYGPILTLSIGSRRSVFISDRSLAHEALVARGATFADRPTPPAVARPLSADRHNINTAPYGPLWRLLRRNLVSGVLHPSRVKLFSPGRRLVLGSLVSDLRAGAEANDGVVVIREVIQFAMFRLLVLMCFGEVFDEMTVRQIEKVQRDYLLHAARLNVLAFVPSFLRYLFGKRIRRALELRKEQQDVFLPLIRARKEKKSDFYSHVDSLLEIELADEGGRRLNDDEMVINCSEFLNAGTDTTSTSLQWIMANIVTHQDVQRKLVREIEEVVSGRAGEEVMVEEEDLQKMPYVKAVVLEGLRRHPPGHFVLPHTATEAAELGGYAIPKEATINFMVAEMGWDEKVWEKPMEFRPERFLEGGEGEGLDITGTKEIKMMPFGAGRRICPGIGVALLHLEYLVANLVREFEWKAVEGEEVDLSEKLEFTVVMKTPLRACISQRRSLWSI